MVGPFIKRTASTVANATKTGWHEFEQELWRTYQMVAPQANQIHNLFETEGEHLVNDHVAFRSFNHPRIDMNVFEENLFKHYNYKAVDTYDIRDKHLFAKFS